MSRDPENNSMKKKTRKTQDQRPVRVVGSGRMVRVRRARLTRAIVGQWTRWNAGTLVYARKQADGNYFLKRVHPKVNEHVNCLNELAGAPRDLLRFEAHSNKTVSRDAGADGAPKPLNG